jgi:hypothetical protein
MSIITMLVSETNVSIILKRYFSVYKETFCWWQEPCYGQMIKEMYEYNK